MRSHDAERAGLAGSEYLVLCALLREGICRAASFKAENSFVGTSHWLLTWTALRHGEDGALFPGGGEDRDGRGGLSEGRLSCQPPCVYGGVGRPGLSTWPARVPQLRCPGESRACGQRVGGDGAGRFAGVRGRSADPRWLSDRWPLAWSAWRLCCLGSCSGGAPWHARGAGLWRGRCATSWLFCWLLGSGSIFEKAQLPVGTAGFEPA